MARVAYFNRHMSASAQNAEASFSCTGAPSFAKAACGCRALISVLDAILVASIFIAIFSLVSLCLSAELCRVFALVLVLVLVIKFQLHTPRRNRTA